MNKKLEKTAATLLIVAPTCCGLFIVGAAIANSTRSISSVRFPSVAIELPGVAIIYQMVRSSLLHALYQIVEFLKALGFCIGSVLLVCLCLFILAKISTRLNQRFVRQSKNYSARCHATKIEKSGYGPIPDDLPQEAQDTHDPVLTNIAVTNYGIWFSGKSKHNSQAAIATDSSNWPGDLRACLEDSIIPTGDIDLYYIITRREGNLRSEYGPFISPDFADAVPKLLKDDQLTIVIIFACMIKKSDLQKVIHLQQPIKLKINVLDQFCNDDQIATAGLYKVIYEKMEPIKADDHDKVDNDDSWMYRY